MYNLNVALILPTKFYPPPIPAGFIPRTHLFDKLDQALACRITLVSAPAGSGKSTMVSAWMPLARKKGAITAWLSLDETDSEPVRFFEIMTACLEDAGVLFDAMTLPSDSGQHPENGFYFRYDLATRFIQGLLTLRRELVLILDDYHLVQSQAVHAALGYILKHMPVHFHMILITRSDPPLGLEWLRLAGQLTEFRMEDLRFSSKEAGVFLNKAIGNQLAERDISDLNERTEGWIAGLQLAAISLRGRQDIPAAIRSFTGSQRFVFDYLLEQVLNRQPAPLREFLLKTSVLDKLTAPLCDEIAETSGASHELLEALDRTNLFLNALDDERRWYRYHPLFADLLKLVLEQTHPGLSVSLHLRASHWFERQGMIQAAVQHAIAAQDMELAARLVSANVLVLVEQADLGPTLARMDAVPRQQRESSPWLGVAHAWALVYSGQLERAENSLFAAEKHLERLHPEEQRRINGQLAAVRAYIAWAQGNQDEAIRFAETADGLLPTGEIALRALNLTTLGNALTQYQPSQRAVQVLEQAIALARKVETSHVYMLASSSMTYSLIQLGSIHKAHAVCQDAIQIAEVYQQQNGQPLTASASVYAEYANVLTVWGEFRTAVHFARHGLLLSERWGQADTITLCLLNLIRALSLTNEAEAAQQTILRARSLARQVSPWFVLNVDELEILYWLDNNEVDQAIRAASMASGELPLHLEARLLLKQKRYNQALSLLESRTSQSEQASPLESVQFGVLRCLTYYMKKEQHQALAILKQTLELAVTENRIAIFLCEGQPMEDLLRLAQRQGIYPAFISRLLTAFEARRSILSVPATEMLVEALSEREMEILALLNGPLSTPEIAGRLVISTNTVRTHIKNIYGKLGVHGRSAAVRRAGELGLLT